LISLAGFVFPPLMLAAIAAIVLAVIGLRNPGEGRFSGRPAAWAALVLGVMGAVSSLVIPGFVVGALVYSLFHGGQLPFDTGPSSTPSQMPSFPPHI
jgi:hypothetical protein